MRINVSCALISIIVIIIISNFQYTKLSFAATTPHEFMITGDFNIHLIILQTLSPLSFCLFFLLSILVNTFTSLRMTKTTFLIWS